jgi:hypothetical protein
MNNGTERCEVQIGKRHGKRSAHYRTVQANGSTDTWHHISVKEAESAQKTGMFNGKPATVYVFSNAAK